MKNINRDFIPGSEWLYFKIYTGIKSADKILTDELFPLAESLKAESVISDYFFIRYTDPRFHIRFRMRISNPVNYGIVFKEFFGRLNPLAEKAIVYDVVCDTYRRELERYSEDNMEAVEDFFCADSGGLLKLLSGIADSEDPEDERWRIALIAVDDIFNAFNMELKAKSASMEAMSGNFKNEFGFTGKKMTKQLNDKYRNLRKEIDDTMDAGSVLRHKYRDDLDVRLNNLTRISSGIDPESVKISDLIHMTMNRLFRTKNRLYEMVIYEFLWRHYKSLIARSNI